MRVCESYIGQHAARRMACQYTSKLVDSYAKLVAKDAIGMTIVKCLGLVIQPPPWILVEIIRNGRNTFVGTSSSHGCRPSLIIQ